MNPPATRYARLGGQRIAYQVVGDGPLDVVFSGGASSNIDFVWDNPDATELFERVARYGRFIQFDPRGIGASDPLPANESFGWEQWVDDLKTVLDTVGSEHAAIVAWADACAPTMLFAATEPARTAALVLLAATARYTSAEDYPYGFPPEQIEARARRIGETWETDASVRAFYPSMADDARFVRWLSRYYRAAGSPGKIERLYAQMFRLDARHALPLIAAPTLLVTTDSPVIPAEHARFIAARIAGAQLVHFPTKDTQPWFSHTDELSDLLEEFLTGKHRTENTQRKLATVLFGIVRTRQSILAHVNRVVSSEVEIFCYLWRKSCVKQEPHGVASGSSRSRTASAA